MVLNKKQKIFFIFFGCTILLFSDQWLKIIAVKEKNFQPNFGLAFSWPLPMPMITIFGFLILILIAYFLIKKITENKNLNLLWLAGALIFTGALSNLIDRLAYGYVIDYLNFYYWYNNLADILITVGSVLAIYYLTRKK
ncbi:MAG TPA: signal peptidase II [bacterium]|nr:signal peptidase II [bacterium]HPL95741.1 signal peptidase II [bacterium]